MFDNILSRKMANDVNFTKSFPQNKSDINKLISGNNSNKQQKQQRSSLIVQPREDTQQQPESQEQESILGKSSNNNNKNTILPVLNPEFNFREIVKNSILLEDHLNHPGKQCGDCIMKHMLALESYADELLSLSPQSKLIDYTYLKTLPSVFRGLQEDWYTARKPLHEIAQELRQIRKKFMTVSFPVVFQNKEKKCQTCSL